jgi:hypothetical protein
LAAAEPGIEFYHKEHEGQAQFEPVASGAPSTGLHNADGVAARLARPLVTAGLPRHLTLRAGAGMRFLLYAHPVFWHPRTALLESLR